MNKYVIHSQGTVFTRISKHRARMLWGKRDIAFCPVNLRPGYPFTPHVTFFATEQIVKFENAVTVFEYYNCSGKETGTYTAFYLLNERTPSRQASPVADSAGETLAVNLATV